eukprot:c18351_g1_i1.p1 GENE.c18351_g1_i1~~c18351_g1_i1.p1  ORF type:complete len:400 (+),score=124.62 c18351_g1_i1:3-1202(+)
MKQIFSSRLVQLRAITENTILQAQGAVRQVLNFLDIAQLLPFPVTSTLIERNGSDELHVGVATMQGWRVNHEDAHYQNCEWKNRVAHFSVFDGHGGTPTAKYFSTNLHTALSSINEPFSDDEIKQCFVSLDETYFHSTKDHYSGTTCVSTIITQNTETKKYYLKVANLGDSRAVLYHVNGEMQSTIDHKPELSLERERIEAAGGHVSDSYPPRLDSCLSLSRAFGDFQFKRNPKIPANRQKVSPEPDVYSWEANEGDIMVLACDGVFDVFDNFELKFEITNRLKNSRDLGRIAADILMLALNKGSQDNMTLIIILFENGNEFRSDNELTIGNYRNEQTPRVKDCYTSFASSYGFQSFPNCCGFCGRLFKNMTPCSCRKLFYCSSQCQANHVDHQNHCRL